MTDWLFAPPPQKAVVKSTGGAVASQNRLASAIGAEVLKAGGNAIDAAVATSFAIGVLEPWMSGIGGGGFMVIAPADGSPVQVIDCAMVSPAALKSADYPMVGGVAPGLFNWPAVKDGRNMKGPHSVAVPGLVAGLGLALERFGTIEWSAALAPAIKLAERGLPLDWYTTLSIAIGARGLAEFEGAKRTYLPDGLPPVPAADGLAHLPLGNLGRTLRRLAEAGARDFYEGEIAKSIAKEMAAAGGCLALADLGNYRAAVHPALEIAYRDVAIAAAPGLSAGPTLAAVLRRLTGTLDTRDRTAGPDADAYRAYAAALAESYTERLTTLGHASPGPSCTTHLSVVDRHGNMVSLTQTLLSRFGSNLLLPETGILLNNGIMWFDPRPNHPNALAPGKRPLSNMCPVVLRRDGRPWVALGASGGRRIMPAVAQVLSFLVDWGMDLEKAFHQPRLDVSGEGRAILDTRLPAAMTDAIAPLMPVIREPVGVYPVQFASPSAVLNDAASGLKYAMSDIASPWSGAVLEQGPS